MSIVPWLIAIPVTALAMGGWRVLIPIILKKRSQRLFASLLHLSNAARFMVWQAAVETFQISEGLAADKHAGDIVRILFNDPDQEDDKKNPFWPAAKIEALCWLDAKPEWRELVVQTIKVQEVARYGLGERNPNAIDKLVESPVLSKYGKNYQMKPELQSYRELVKRMAHGCSVTTKGVLQHKFQV